MTQGGYNPIELVYQYEPTPAVLSSNQAKYILGAQANLWTEYISTLSKIEYSIFPRIAALSEVLWSPKSKRNWSNFENRLERQIQWYKQMGIQYSNAWEQPQTAIIALPSAKVGWKIEGPSTHKYWIKTPGDTSLKAYQQPFVFSQKGIYQLLNDRKQKLVEQAFHPHAATGALITLNIPASTYYPGNGAFTLVDGIINDKGLDRKEEWLGFSGTDADVWITLPKQVAINEVVVHTLDQNESWIYLPQQITISVYTDLSLPAQTIQQKIDFLQDKGKRAINIPISADARFIRIQATNYGIIPEGKPGAGNPAWLFLDEIEIN